MGVKEDLHVRIAEGLMAEVRGYAARNGISLSAAVSVLLRLGLLETPRS